MMNEIELNAIAPPKLIAEMEAIIPLGISDIQESINNLSIKIDEKNKYIKSKALQYDTLSVNYDSEEVRLYCRNINGDVKTQIISKATINKAGILTSEDKKKIEYKVIKLVGFGTISSGNTGVTGEGQYFVSNDNKKLYVSSNYNSPTSFNVTEVPFIDGAIYIYNNELYVYNGTEVISAITSFEKKIYDTLVEIINVFAEDDDIIKDNALHYNKIGFIAYSDKVELYAKNINDDKVRYDTINSATTEKAGVMSAEDKLSLDSIPNEIKKIKYGDTIVAQTREIYSKDSNIDIDTFLKRTTGGSTSISNGVASIKQIGGNIIKNMLGNFKNISTNIKYNVEFKNDYVIINAKDKYVGDTADSSHIGISTLNFISGHTYYISANCYSEVDREVYICLAVNGYARVNKFIDIQAKEWSFASKIITITGDDLEPYISIYPFGITNDIFIQEGAFVLYGGINIIDLTEVYGAGYEPSKEECDKIFGVVDILLQGLTVAQPTSLKSIGFNQWNPNNIILNTGIVSGGFESDLPTHIAIVECLPCKIGDEENNGYVIGYGENELWDEDGIEVYFSPLNPLKIDDDIQLYMCKLEKNLTYNTYIPKCKGYFIIVTPTVDKFCVHFYWNDDKSLYNYEKYIESNIIFPKIPQISEWGLAGISFNIQDVIDFDINKFTKRVGCVDLNSLNWIKMQSNRFRTKDLNFNKIINNIQLMCDKYVVLPTIYTKEIYINAKLKNVIFPVYYDNDINIITDVEYNTIEDFKSAISGVKLYYELSVPEEYPIISNIFNNYIVNDYGVEEFIGTQIPLKSNTLSYMRSLVSEIRDFLNRLMDELDTNDATVIADRILAVIKSSIEPTTIK